jgi:DNA mismatch repair ATPase MutS
MLRKDYDLCILRYTKVEKLMEEMDIDNGFYDKLSILLSHIDDILNTFYEAKHGNPLENTQLFEIKSFLYFTRQIASLIHEKSLDNQFKLDKLDKLWKVLDIEERNAPTFYVSNRYSKKLTELRMNLDKVENEIHDEIKTINGYISDELGFSEPKDRIVVTRMNPSLVKKLEKTELYHKVEQNFANITFDKSKSSRLLELEDKKSSLKEKIKEEEEKVRIDLSERVNDYANQLIENSTTIAQLDFDLAKAKYALDNSCVIPEVSKEKAILIRNGRNLKVEEECEDLDITYFPINVDFQSNVALITGSNMGGKSTLLRTIGNMFFHLALAIPLPVDYAKLPLVDFIFFSLDSTMERVSGLSCFGMEMYEINYYISIEDKFGLYLMDEFARSTNPFEGEAFCYSILQFLKRKNALTIFVTHYSKPTQIGSIEHYQVKGLSEVDREGLKHKMEDTSNLGDRLKLLNKHMDYSLRRVYDDSTIPYEALTVAELLGIKKEILDGVRDILKD